MKIIDYGAVRVGKLVTLKAYMRIAMQEGWQPFGGIAITERDGKITYAQAMVKYGAGTPVTYGT